jgi:ABC-type glycerol-3-phosphate transport system substrate-binding protein
MPLVSRAAAATVALAVLAGCGGDGTDAKDWAKAVCTALTPWRQEISDLTTQAQQQLSVAKTAEQTKTNVVALLTGAEQASEKARRGVVDAGVPDVSRGAEIAKHFAASLEKARDAYGHAKTSVSALPTSDEKVFYANVKTTFDTLRDEYAKSALDTENVGSNDLQKAFDEVPECR